MGIYRRTWHSHLHTWPCRGSRNCGRHWHTLDRRSCGRRRPQSEKLQCHFTKQTTWIQFCSASYYCVTYLWPIYSRFDGNPLHYLFEKCSMTFYLVVFFLCPTLNLFIKSYFVLVEVWSLGRFRTGTLTPTLKVSSCAVSEAHVRVVYSVRPAEGIEHFRTRAVVLLVSKS